MSFSEVYKQSLGQWSPDGRFLAAASDQRLLVRDAETLKLVQVFICLERIERLGWSPDSSHILTEVSKQGLVQVWSAHDGDWQCRIDEGRAGVAHTFWAPNARHVLVVSDFHMYLSVWPLQDGATPTRIRGPKYAHRGAAFSHSGGQLLAVLRRADCRDSVSVHDCEAGHTELVRFHVACDCADLAWAADDAALILWERPARSSRFFWYSLRGDLLAQAEDCGLVRTVATSPSGNLLAAGGLDGALQIINGSGRRVVARLAHCLRTACAEATSDQEIAVFREEDSPRLHDDGASDGALPLVAPTPRYVRLPARAAMRLPEERPPPTGPVDTAMLDGDGMLREGVGAVAFSPDERFVATRHDGFPTAVWVWDVGRLCLAALLLHRSPVRACAWDPSFAARGVAARLAMATADASLFFWSPGRASAVASPATAHSKLRWRFDGLALLVQERDRCCVFYPGPPSCRIVAPAAAGAAPTSATEPAAE